MPSEDHSREIVLSVGPTLAANLNTFPPKNRMQPIGFLPAQTVGTCTCFSILWALEAIVGTEAKDGESGT